MMCSAAPLLAAACLLLLVAPSFAAEPRTWTDTAGRTLNGALVRQDATKVWVARANGQEVAIDKSRLSAADLEFLRSQPAASSAPPPRPAVTGAARPGQSIFKTVPIDRTAWKPSSDIFHAGGIAFTQRLQTPHYLVLAAEKVKPEMMAAYAEAAERTWADCHRDLPGLDAVLKEKRMALWLVDTEQGHTAFGNWLRNRGTAASSWEDLAIAGAALSDETCEELGVVATSREFRIDKFSTTAHRSADWPNRIHFLASDLLYLHLWDVGESEPQADGSRRSFNALRLGYAFYKEWQIAGKIATDLIVGGTTVEGFQNGRRWADAVRKVLKNPSARPSLDDLLKTRAAGAQPIDVACAFGMMQFFNADPARFKAFDALLLEARTAKKMPTTEEFAKALGYDSPAAFDTAWIGFMTSDAFK